MLNPQRILPHSLIYERVWGYDFGPSSNALRVYIGYLRRKLSDLGAPDLIHNVRGVGYMLREAGS
jgi:two-component system response regulator MprA